GIYGSVGLLPAKVSPGVASPVHGTATPRASAFSPESFRRLPSVTQASAIGEERRPPPGVLNRVLFTNLPALVEPTLRQPRPGLWRTAARFGNDATRSCARHTSALGRKDQNLSLLREFCLPRRTRIRAFPSAPRLPPA